jgi:CMD domain protein
MPNTTKSSLSATDAETRDSINELAGVAPDSPVGQLRAQRPEVVRAAQASYRTLLEPDDPAGVSRREREMIALRVAVLTPSPTVAAWHRDRLRGLGATDADLAAIEQFPDGTRLSPRETAILRYTDRLTREPGTARPEHIADVKAAGLSPRDIVTIAQLIAYMSFAVRLIAGLRLLAEEI